MQTIQRQPDPELLNLDRYLRKLASRGPGAWSPERLQLAARDYRRFLRLRQQHPGTPLVPTELMDAVWHEHILDTMQYAADTQHLFGAFLHHCPEFPSEPTRNDLSAGLAATLALYQAAFGEAPAELAAARCDGKKCHVDTPCRCR